jgi:hypothetical protein
MNRIISISILFASMLVLVFSKPAYNQITFRKGYFIDKQGIKTECLIKDVDKYSVSNQIEYKMDESSKAYELRTETISEIGIDGLSKFVKAKVLIDRSSADMNNLSKSKEPFWSEEELFLKVLLEGKASLYFYTDAGNQLFFFSVDSSDIRQLVYKKYLIDSRNAGTNNAFRTQLWQFVRCDNTESQYVEQLQYNHRELEKYFRKYNECMGSASVQFVTDPARETFHLKLAPGLNYSTFFIGESEFESVNLDFGGKPTFQFGVEAEYILPVNRNKWSILVEPGFYTFHAETPSQNGVSKVRLNTIEFPAGIRYYMFLNPDCKLFVDFLFVPGMSFHLNSLIISKRFIINDLYNISVGGGVNYKKLSAELRYYSKRDLLIMRNGYYYSEYERVALVLGYRIF